MKSNITDLTEYFSESYDDYVEESVDSYDDDESDVHKASFMENYDYENYSGEDGVFQEFTLLELIAVANVAVNVAKVVKMVMKRKNFPKYVAAFPEKALALSEYIESHKDGVDKKEIKSLIRNVKKSLSPILARVNSSDRLTVSEKKVFNELDDLCSDLLQMGMITKNDEKNNKQRVPERLKELLEKIKESIKCIEHIGEIYPTKNASDTVEECFTNHNMTDIYSENSDVIFMKDDKAYQEEYAEEFNGYADAFFDEATEPTKKGCFSKLFDPHAKLFDRINECKSECIKPIVDKGAADRISWGWVKSYFKRSKHTHATTQQEYGYTDIDEYENDSYAVRTLKQLLSYSNSILTRGRLQKKFSTQERSIVKDITTVGYELLDGIDGILDSDYMDQKLIDNLYKDAVSLNDLCDKL